VPYSVTTWGTGNVGSYAVRAVLNHPALKFNRYHQPGLVNIGESPFNGEELVAGRGLRLACGVLIA
jgi:4-hydroxy-tetrahydrodipicolinate reductase